MKPTGEPKEQVEKAESKEKKKSLIKNAGMPLNDDELTLISGGGRMPTEYEQARDEVRRYCLELLRASDERKKEIKRLLRTNSCQGKLYLEIGQEMGLITR